jgi:hypothetical protein
MKVLEVIYTHCMPFLNDLWKGGYSKGRSELLYSGRNESNPYIMKQIRQDRRPSDTSKEKHELFDRLFYEEFKIKGRSQCLFGTGDRMTAYGASTYMIFPMGKYKVLWSNKVRDLYKDPYTDQIMMKDYQTDEERDILLRKKIISTYKTGDIVKALQSKNEIMLSTNRVSWFKSFLYGDTIASYIYTMKNTFPTNQSIDTWLNKIENENSTSLYWDNNVDLY